jgi:thiamine biosynthesis lipoprotein
MVTKEIPFLVGRFQAMGCPCEILLDTTDSSLLAKQLDAARREAERIEKKYSRFISGTIVDQISHSKGKKLEVDEETAGILDYANECYEMSDGLFDITRRGWNQVSWNRPFIQLPAGFEIDFGGICKEYAADRILDLLRKRHNVSTLVNLGGDIAAVGERLWSVGIEDPAQPGHIIHTVHLRQGGLATSGTTKRPGHILNPKTGRPVAQAPQSVTVAAKTCTEAGFWSTLAILHGDRAETFLKENSLESWCYRSAA